MLTKEKEKKKWNNDDNNDKEERRRIQSQSKDEGFDIKNVTYLLQYGYDHYRFHRNCS